jgi:hypothetical protein
LKIVKIIALGTKNSPTKSKRLYFSISGGTSPIIARARIGIELGDASVTTVVLATLATFTFS